MTEAQRIEALEGHLKKYASYPEVGVRLGSLLGDLSLPAPAPCSLPRVGHPACDGAYSRDAQGSLGKRLSDVVALSSYRGLTVATSIE